MSIPDEVLVQLTYLIRILLAGLCGGVVGYERQSRRKMAGIRTHVIIAVAASLMIILSKYGFYDVLSTYIRLDPSRVAAGVITAISFIGTGVIYLKNNNVSGLTTSAGLWATVGIGMVIGSGLYFIGIATTCIILLVELFLGRRGLLAERNAEGRKLEVEYTEPDGTDDILPWVLTQLQAWDCAIERTSILRKPEHSIKVTLLITVPAFFDPMAFLTVLRSHDRIQKISL